MNKIIYMTYFKDVPDKVFNRWLKLNPDYKIDFSLDDKCISFLKNNYNNYVGNLFTKINKGMYKADLWRLCKLYKNSGIYADVDLVPYINLNDYDDDVTFYTCYHPIVKNIFQAFIINKQINNPLMLCFLISFLVNKPYDNNDFLGPTFDMYKCIKYNVGKELEPFKKYYIDVVRIPINFGSSNENIKIINLHYFPDDIDYTIELQDNIYKDKFNFSIFKNYLIIERLDEEHGWGFNHSCDICIKSKQVIYLFQESADAGTSWVQSYVSDNDKKLMDSRDLEYFYNGRQW